MSYRVTTDRGHVYINAAGQPLGTGLLAKAREVCRNSLAYTDKVELFAENTGVKYIHKDGAETPRWLLMETYAKEQIK